MSHFFNQQFQSLSGTHKYKLIYIVGASGSGKDSIIQYCCEQLFEHFPVPVLVPHRFITRKDTQHEKSLYLTEDEFFQKSEENGFAMQWQANHFHYGIGKEIDASLLENCIVVVNGSREYLPTAKKKYGTVLYSIAIEAPEDVLKKRLHERGRESVGDIQLRLQRHQHLTQTITTDAVIHNVASVKQAAQTLVKAIMSICINN